jgi:hypothetical protein
VNPNISVSVDLTGWLGEFQREADAALADLMQIREAAQQKAYASEGTNHKMGVVTVVLPNMDAAEATAPARAARTCFLTCIGKFASFLDRLLASQQLMKEGVKITRNLEGEEQIKAYLDQYMKEKIGQVARDQKLSNPKKIAAFTGLPPFLLGAALEYFRLRRALEHHQDIPDQDLNVPITRIGLFADDQEIEQVPHILHGGQRLDARIMTELRIFKAGEKIVLTPEDVYGIIVMLRLNIVPEIFRVHLESLNPATLGAT